ncbi:serine protease inhibitor A6 [Bombina bombina]|uniref:serine protease inhibitor A6 n=1 Tax=Bombina bombina TaxID=8345 RepID=UPI00235B2193|nr:serine protease inhibitor A6 [Bombina bombina]
MRIFFYLTCFLTLTLASRHSASKHISSKQNASKEDISSKKTHPHKHGHNEETLAAKEVEEANFLFSLDMYKHLSSKSVSSPEKNLFYSPLSISSTLAMLSLGAKHQTHSQILELLKLKHAKIEDKMIHKAYGNLLHVLDQPKSDLQFKFGNAIFVASNLKMVKSFVSQVKQYYQAEIMATNFSNGNAAEKKVNDYVRYKTKGKIDNIVEHLDPYTEMVLANYILFKGKWTDNFQSQLTHTRYFMLDSHTKVHVSMMNRIGLYKTFRDRTHQCQILQLPYKNNAFMLLIIPELGQIHTIEQILSKETVTKWIDSIASSFVNLYLPKFSISAVLQIKKTFSQMGMTDIFSEKADFSGIATKFNVKVSKAIHKAVLNINEYGTEATGATAIPVIPTALFPALMVDRPFILMIFNEETRSILFMGRVMDPTQK